MNKDYVTGIKFTKDELDSLIDSLTYAETCLKILSVNFGLDSEKQKDKLFQLKNDIMSIRKGLSNSKEETHERFVGYSGQNCEVCD